MRSKLCPIEVKRERLAALEGVRAVYGDAAIGMKLVEVNV
jgi:hypothetical protein